MADLTLRSVKGSALSFTEMDSNFLALDSDISGLFATKSTSDLSEGTNLYYTAVRVDSDIDARVTKTFVDALNINADQLDGQEATDFLASGTSDNFTSGTLTFDNGTVLTAAAGATVNFNNTTGTAPFTVASTTVVTNLNADAVDGFRGIAIYDSAGTLLNGA